MSIIFCSVKVVEKKLRSSDSKNPTWGRPPGTCPCRKSGWSSRRTAIRCSSMTRPRSSCGASIATRGTSGTGCHLPRPDRRHCRRCCCCCCHASQAATEHQRRACLPLCRAAPDLVEKQVSLPHELLSSLTASPDGDGTADNGSGSSARVRARCPPAALLFSCLLLQITLCLSRHLPPPVCCPLPAAASYELLHSADWLPA